MESTKTPTKTPTANIYVKRRGTDEVVSQIPVSLPTSERTLERVMMGLLRNMNTDQFYADESEVDRALAAQYSAVKKLGADC